MKEIRLSDLPMPEKRAAWNRLQLEHPDVARFITEMSAAFGKPESVVVRIKE